jgi:hypothetical protein
MQKLISILVAAMFAAVTLNAVAAEEMGKEPTKKVAKAKVKAKSKVKAKAKDTTKMKDGAMDKGAKENEKMGK